MKTVEESRIRGAVWARDLREAELDRACRGITEKSFAKGSYICHRGDRLDYWTGVIEGLVKIGTISRGGRPMTFAGVTGGAWFGEGSVLKDEPRLYDIVALRDTRMAMMNRATFFWLYENSIGFTRFLVRQLNERVGQFIATVELDRISGPRARIARHLAWLFHPVLYPGVGDEIAISQEELALLAGMSRAVTNRALRQLVDEGILATAHGKIRVIDLARLRAYDN